MLKLSNQRLTCFLAIAPGRDKKWLYSAVNLYRNCFKHLGKTAAEREEDQKTLDQFNDGVNEFLLFADGTIELDGGYKIKISGTISKDDASKIAQREAELEFGKSA